MPTALPIDEDRTLSSRLTSELRDSIITGQIAQGSQLSEAKLAKELNVSRGPLREAIRRLEGMKLIQSRPQYGSRVVKLNLSDIIEIYIARESLESTAARLAASNMDSSEIDNLHRLLDTYAKLLKQSNNASVPAEHDYAFHEAVINGSKNFVIKHLLIGQLYHLIKMFRYQNEPFRTSGVAALAEHRQVVYALEQRDTLLAEVTMRRHITKATQRIEQQFKKAKHNQSLSREK